MNPCPYQCKDKRYPNESTTWVRGQYANDGFYQVRCAVCECAGPKKETPEEATEEWNKLVNLSLVAPIDLDYLHLCGGVSMSSCPECGGGFKKAAGKCGTCEGAGKIPTWKLWEMNK